MQVDIQNAGITDTYKYKIPINKQFLIFYIKFSRATL